MEKTASGFLHLVYHVTSKLSAELGARYSTDEKSQQYYHTYTATVPANFLFTPGTLVYPPGTGGSTRNAPIYAASPRVAGNPPANGRSQLEIAVQQQELENPEANHLETAARRLSLRPSGAEDHVPRLQLDRAAAVVKC